MVVANGHTKVVDLRSDTVTKPTPAMMAAVAALHPSDFGDDVYAEDPTVNELQRQAAELMGKEAAIFVPTGSMGNLASILAHCGRGDEVLLGSDSHLLHYEAGGISALGGVVMHVVPSLANGELPLHLLDEAMRNRPDDQHSARPRVVAIEQTHNRAGGRVLSLDYLTSLKTWATKQQLTVHIDGARIHNAATALGVPVKDIADQADTLTFCLSKGLGAPVGSVIVGPVAFIHRVHKLRKQLGGGMRQVAILAAPGLVALRDTPPLLAEDHANAKLIARELAKMDLVEIDEAAVESNIVLWHLKPAAPPIIDVLRRLKQAGFILGGMKGGIRAVTHYDVTKEDCMAFTEALREALTA